MNKNFKTIKIFFHSSGLKRATFRTVFRVENGIFQLSFLRETFQFSFFKTQLKSDTFDSSKKSYVRIFCHCTWIIIAFIDKNSCLKPGDNANIEFKDFCGQNFFFFFVE